MSDNIVARLRLAFNVWLSDGEVDDLAWDAAADEIQRLRDGIEKYVTSISDSYCTPAMERDALELLKAAWRGD